jgi:hypothetical protein
VSTTVVLPVVRGIVTAYTVHAGDVVTDILVCFAVTTVA